MRAIPAPQSIKPSEKSTDTVIRDLTLICNFATIGIGIRTTKKSEIVLMVPQANRFAASLIGQFCGVRERVQ